MIPACPRHGVCASSHPMVQQDDSAAQEADGLRVDRRDEQLVPEAAEGGGQDERDRNRDQLIDDQRPQQDGADVPPRAA